MTITPTERLQVIGLLTLAKHYNEFLKKIETALIELLETEDPSGHCCDAIYSDYSADELLKKLGIEVV